MAWKAEEPPWNEAAKRIFDIVASAVGLIVLAPVIAVLAQVVRLDSPGPVLYRGTRVGRYGRPFSMLKFRTMVVDAERLGGPSTSDDDPRITRAGRALRKAKLDELPQLFNVLHGEMSIVGPRPEVRQAVAGTSHQVADKQFTAPWVYFVPVRDRDLCGADPPGSFEANSLRQAAVME